LSLDDLKTKNIFYFFCVFKPFSARQDEKIIWSRRDKSLVRLVQKFCQDEMKGIFANKLKKRPRVTVITRGLTIISCY